MRVAQTSAIEFNTYQTVPRLCSGCSHHAQKYSAARPHAIAAAVCRTRCFGLSRGSRPPSAVAPAPELRAWLVALGTQRPLGIMDDHGRRSADLASSNRKGTIARSLARKIAGRDARRI